MHVIVAAMLVQWFLVSFLWCTNMAATPLPFEFLGIGPKGLDDNYKKRTDLHCKRPLVIY